MSFLFSVHRAATPAYNPNVPEATAASRRAPSQVSELQDEVERLLLISEALWSILREKHGLDELALVERITELDLRDGKLDNRNAPAPPVPCPHCRRILAKRRPLCLYCGTPTLQSPFQR